MTAKELYDGKPATEKERKFWARQILTENPILVDTANEYIELGGDPVDFLKMGIAIKRAELKSK